MEVYFPVFAEDKNDNEIRIHALNIILTQTPSTTDMARIVAVLRTDKDYEVINYVFTKLEAMARSDFNQAKGLRQVVLDGVLGPPRLVRYTCRGFCISLVPEATYQARDLEGRRVSSRRPSTSRVRENRRDFLPIHPPFVACALLYSSSTHENCVQ